MSTRLADANKQPVSTMSDWLIKHSLDRVALAKLVANAAAVEEYEAWQEAVTKKAEGGEGVGAGDGQGGESASGQGEAKTETAVEDVAKEPKPLAPPSVKGSWRGRGRGRGRGGSRGGGGIGSRVGLRRQRAEGSESSAEEDAVETEEGDEQMQDEEKEVVATDDPMEVERRAEDAKEALVEEAPQAMDIDMTKGSSSAAVSIKGTEEMGGKESAALAVPQEANIAEPLPGESGIQAQEPIPGTATEAAPSKEPPGRTLLRPRDVVALEELIGKPAPVISSLSSASTTTTAGGDGAAVTSASSEPSCLVKGSSWESPENCIGHCCRCDMRLPYCYQLSVCQYDLYIPLSPRLLLIFTSRKLFPHAECSGRMITSGTQPTSWGMIPRPSSTASGTTSTSSTRASTWPRRSEKAGCSGYLWWTSPCGHRHPSDNPHQERSHPRRQRTRLLLPLGWLLPSPRPPAPPCLPYRSPALLHLHRPLP